MIRIVLILSAFFGFSKSGISQNPNSVLPVHTKTPIQLITPVGVAGQATGLKTGPIQVGVDTSSRSNPFMDYISYEIAAITARTLMHVLA